MKASVSKPNYAWVDAAKGLCMILVVVMHTALWMDNEIISDGTGIWSRISQVLAPLRMPLFFFVSGFLAVSALRRPLGASRGRTLGLYYIYALWTLLFLSRLFLPMARGGGEAPSAFELGLSLILPTSFWYLWALPAFFLASYGLERLLGSRSVYALAPLALLCFVAPLVDDLTVPILGAPMDALKVGSVCANFVWFFLGIHYRDVWLRLIESATWKKLATCALAYAVLYAGADAIGLRIELKPVLSLMALFVAAQLLGVVGMDNWPTRTLRRVGTQTLPVYIFHIFLISILSAATKILGLASVFESNIEFWAIVIPPIGAAAITFASFQMGKLIINSPFAWLLSPAWLDRKRIPSTA